MSSSAVAMVKSERDEWVALVTAADDTWLTRLLAARVDLVMVAPADLHQLAEEVLSPGRLRVCYETADRTTAQVLEALCTLPTPIGPDALARALGTEPGPLEPVLAELEAAALVLRRSGALHRNPGLPAAIPRPAGLGPSLRQVLPDQPAPLLAAMAGRIGVDDAGLDHAALVEAIAIVLSSPERVTALVAAGPDGTEDIVNQMAARPMQLHLGYGRQQAAQSDRTPEGWLLRRGLLVLTGWETLTMPAEPALAWRGGLLFESFQASAPVPVVTPVDTARVDQLAAEMALQLVADVAMMLDAWATEPARLLQSGGLGTRELRRVAKLTGRPEADMARLAELAELAGLAKDNESGDAVVPTAGYDEWLERPAAARWTWLARAWRNAPLHLSLAGSPDTRGKPIPALMYQPPDLDALAQRVLVLRVLSAAPDGHAVDRAALAAVVEWQAPVLWRRGPARPDRLISWASDEAELIGVTAGGALSSFGRLLVDSDDEAASAALGRLAPPATTQVVLQADLTAVVAGELAAAVRGELDLLADVESTGAATVYRFSEASLRRGFDAGRSADQIVAFLDEHASKGVPQPLAYLIGDMGRRYGQIRVGPARCFVRSDDPALVTEVSRARKTTRLHLRLLAPTVAVSDADQATVERVLRDAGYLAATEDTDGALVLRRPPAHRAPARPGEDTTAEPGEDRLLALLGDTGMVAALTGRSSAAIVADRDAGAGPVDLSAVIHRLRHPPRGRTKDRPAPQPGPIRLALGEPFAAPDLDEDDQLVRPGHIASGARAIQDLLGEAWDNGWVVRMSYRDSVTAESEFYADVLEVGTRKVTAIRFPQTTRSRLLLSNIHWARVATEAEEEALLA